MTLHQFQALKLWHSHHGGRPLEKGAWDVVLTLWMMGWVGLPAALLLGAGWAEVACLAALFLPGSYVTWRARLHRRGRLRCDWIGALSR
jgi:hypothetical protein